MRNVPQEDAAIFDLNVYPDYEAVSKHAAELIIDQVRMKPELLLCAATGFSPLRTYEILTERGKRETHLFDRLRIGKLDEWGGLPMDNASTCETYLRRHLTGPLGVSDDRHISFQSDAEDPVAECQRVQDEINNQGPIDLCVLGLGLNGHLALNEPAAELNPRAHVTRLSEQTLQHPMVRGVQKNRLQYGLTIGMADILRSKKILLLVSGAHKQAAVARLRSSFISTKFPASFLRLHNNVTCLCDKESAGFSTEAQ